MANFQVHDVIFLTPARVSYSANGVKYEANVSIDIVNRKVYAEYDEFASEEVFAYLDEVNTLPEDFFAASEEIQQEAIKAVEETEQLKRQHCTGVEYGNA